MITRFLFSLLLSYSLFGATYYVRKDGSLGNNGLADNAGGAFLTIAQATAVVNQGDIVYVRSGTYQEYVALTRPGQPGNPIRWSGQKSGTNFLTIIDPSVVVPSGDWVLDTEYGASGVYKYPNVTTEVGFRPGGVFVDDYWAMEHREKRWRKSLFSAGNTTLAWQTTSGLWTGAMSITESGAIWPNGVIDQGRFMGPTYLNTFIWDGIGAAWFVTNQTVYLKIRDGSNPNSHEIRFSDNGEDTNPNKIQTGTTQYNMIVRKAPLMVYASHNTIENFHIRGGANASMFVGAPPSDSGIATPASIAGVIINTNLLQHGSRQLVVSGSTTLPISDMEVTRNMMDQKQAWAMYHDSGAYSYLADAHVSQHPYMLNSWKHWMIYWGSKYLNYYDAGTNRLTIPYTGSDGLPVTGTISIPSGSTTATITTGNFRFNNGMSTASGHLWGMLVFPTAPTYRPRIVVVPSSASTTVTLDTAAPSTINVASGWQIHTYASVSGIEAGHYRMTGVRSNIKVVWNNMSNGGGAGGMDNTAFLNKGYNVTGNVIASNLIENIASQAIWIRPHGIADLRVFENDIRNASMFMRFQDVNNNSTDPTPVVYVYRNRGWNPRYLGSMSYVHLNTSTVNTNWLDLRFYNNSYEGGDDHGMDFASSSNPAKALIFSKMKFFNNIIGVGRKDDQPDGVRGTLFISYTTASYPQVYDYNLFSAPQPLSSTKTVSPKDGGHNIINSNPFEWGGTWPPATLPSFQITPNSQAYNAGTNLAGLGWPDTRTASGAWDMGAEEWTAETVTTNEFRIAVFPQDAPTERARIQDADYDPPTVPSVLFSVHRQDGNMTGDAFFELDYATTPGSAEVTEGVDYTLAPWTYVIPDGMSWTNVEVIQPIRNTNYYGQRLLRVSVRPSQNYTIGSPSFGDILVEEADEAPAGGTNMLYLVVGSALRDGDYPTSPASIFSIHRIKYEGGAWVPKTNGAQAFEFSLSSPNGVMQGIDYTITNFTGTLADGDWYTNIFIYPKRNTLYTGPRTLTVTLEPGTYFIDPNSGAGDFDVEDIDSPEQVSVSVAFAGSNILSETGTPLEVRVSRVATDISGALSGTWNWSGQLVVNTDYTVTDNDAGTTNDHLNWTIPADEPFQSYYVTAIPDAVYTGPRSGAGSILPGSGYNVAGASATFESADAEHPPGVGAGPDRPGEHLVPKPPL